MALLQASNYTESFFMVPVRKISFNPAPKDDVAETIRRGWGASVQVASTCRKRGGDEDQESQDPKRRKTTIKFVRTENGAPVTGDGEGLERGG